MDATFSLARLIEEFNALCEAKDFEGAEELLAGALARQPQHEPFLHYQFGKLYAQWNKLSSAVNHLTRAAELANGKRDEIFMIQVVEELKQARNRQLMQQP